MAHKKTQAGLHVGQVVSYRGQQVMIKAFPTTHTAAVVPVPLHSARWVVRTVSMSDLR
jgi:hypothetical protein